MCAHHDSQQHEQAVPITRRRLLAGTGGLAVAGLAAACDRAPTGPTRIGPDSPQVARAAARRTRPGANTRRFHLTPAARPVDLGDRTVATWSYGPSLPGPLLRGTSGERMQVAVHNQLSEPTTVHWHGLAIRNDMDGVPFLTQPPIGPGTAHTYEFTLPRAGTYLYHSHVHLQRARGLYGPLVIDDPAEPGDYDTEFVVTLDDWTDGVTATPPQVLTSLRSKRHYRVPVQAGALDAGPAIPTSVPAPSGRTGTHLVGIPPGLGGDIQYPFHLLNGRTPTAPDVLRAKPGRRVRIRLINAAASSTYRIALGGHRLTVIATDGYPADPVTVDTLRIASGERYDLLATLADGVFPLAAVAEGRRAQALAIIRTGAGPTPPATVQPRELTGRMLTLSDLHATDAVVLPDRHPTARHDLWLDGDMADYIWKIDGHPYQARHPFAGITPVPVHPGDRLRIRIRNETPMYHPIHIHGHTFQIRAIGPLAGHATAIPQGPRKDTVHVAPTQAITLDLAADNPGQWLTHCHNAYHLASGMATVLSYRT